MAKHTKKINLTQISLTHVVLGVILVISYIILSVSGFVLSPKLMDCDSAKAFTHAAMMWDTHSFVIEGWQNITTLELDCAAFFAILFYGMFKNVFVAFSLSNMIFMALFIWAVVRLFGKEKKNEALLSLNLILIPYSVGMLSYYNMLMFNASQYCVKILVPLMLIGVLCKHEKDETKKARISSIVFEVLCYLFTFISVFSSGIYIVVAALCPILLVWVLSSLQKNEKPSKAELRAISVTVLVTILGTVCNKLAGVGAKGNSMTLVPFAEFWQNLETQILGIFELFGVWVGDEVAVLSFDGIDFLIRIGFAGLLIAAIFVNTAKLCKGKLTIKKTMLVVLSWWTFLILVVTDTRYGSATSEFRYHIMGMVPAMCLFASDVLQEGTIRFGKKPILAFFVLLLLILNGLSYKRLYSYDATYPELQAVCDYAKENGLERVYFMNDTGASEICRAIDPENCVYLTVNGAGTVWCFDYFKEYNDEEVLLENAAMVASLEDFDFGDGVELYDYYYTKTDTFGKYIMYR